MFMVMIKLVITIVKILCMSKKIYYLIKVKKNQLLSPKLANANSYRNNITLSPSIEFEDENNNWSIIISPDNSVSSDESMVSGNVSADVTHLSLNDLSLGSISNPNESMCSIKGNNVTLDFKNFTPYSLLNMKMQNSNNKINNVRDHRLSISSNTTLNNINNSAIYSTANTNSDLADTSMNTTFLSNCTLNGNSSFIIQSSDNPDIVLTSEEQFRKFISQLIKSEELNITDNQNKILTPLNTSNCNTNTSYSETMVSQPQSQPQSQSHSQSQYVPCEMSNIPATSVQSHSMNHSYVPVNNNSNNNNNNNIISTTTITTTPTTNNNNTINNNNNNSSNNSGSSIISTPLSAHSTNSASNYYANNPSNIIINQQHLSPYHENTSQLQSQSQSQLQTSQSNQNQYLYQQIAPLSSLTINTNIKPPNPLDNIYTTPINTPTPTSTINESMINKSNLSIISPHSKLNVNEPLAYQSQQQNDHINSKFHIQTHINTNPFIKPNSATTTTPTKANYINSYISHNRCRSLSNYEIARLDSTKFNTTSLNITPLSALSPYDITQHQSSQQQQPLILPSNLVSLNYANSGSSNSNSTELKERNTIHYHPPVVMNGLSSNSNNNTNLHSLYPNVTVNQNQNRYDSTTLNDMNDLEIICNK